MSIVLRCLPATALAVSWFVVVAGAAEAAPPPSPPATSASSTASNTPDPEPFFSDLAGGTVHVSDRRGKVVVLNFWATWCGPCRSEMPVFVKLDRDLGPKGVKVIAAAANGRSDAESVRAAMREMGMTFEVWLWANAGDMRHYGVGPGLPSTVVVGKDGVVRQRFQGVVDEARLRPVVEAALAAAP